MKRSGSIVAIALAALCGGAAAQAGIDDAAERARLRSERAQAEARYVEAARQCDTRFAVTACVDAARVERRDALAKLRNEEGVLDQAERKRRTAERAAGIREKPAHDDAPRASVRQAPPAAADTPAPRLHLRVPKEATPAGRREKLSPHAESRNREAYERRQQDAEGHREAVAQRNAERAAKAKKPSQPLPLPPDAAASAAAR